MADVSYLWYVWDMWYMWWICVICIGVIIVFVNYIFVIIIACNVPVIRYIFVVFISKNREKRKKQFWSLCRVHKPKHSLKWPSRVCRKAALPSARTLALGKDSKLCRVLPLGTRRSRRQRPPPRGNFAEYRGSRQPLCRVPEKGHSAKPLCRQRLCRVVFAECYTRQRLRWVLSGLCRVHLALGKDPDSGSVPWHVHGYIMCRTMYMLLVKFS